MLGGSKALWPLVSFCLAFAAGCPTTYVMIGQTPDAGAAGAAGSSAGSGAGEGEIGDGSCVSCDRVGDTWSMDSGSGGSGSIQVQCHVAVGGCASGAEGCPVLCVQPCDPFYDPNCH